MTEARVESLNRGLFKALGTMISRSRLAASLGITFDGNRSLYSALGYKQTLDFSDYAARYARGGIAKKVVDAYPNSTWRNLPVIQVDDADVDFVTAWNSLTTRTQIFHYLQRADKISGIGQYGAIMIGAAGGTKLSEPLPRMSGPDDVLYFTPYSQGNVTIGTFERDPSSPRFGLPLEYNVNLVRYEGDPGGGVTSPVHYSRIIHVAENLLEDNIFGTPRMESVWNYLDDLDKVVGGASEACWRTMDRGILFNVDKDAQLEPGEEERLSEEIDEYIHGFRRYVRGQGMEAHLLGSDVPDPRGPFSVLSSLISGTTGIPQRVLFGSERGELASTQDERNYGARVKERQISYAEPIILRPIIDRLIEHGALPTPSNGYRIVWPDLTAQSNQELADIAARVAQAIRNVSGQPANMMVMEPDRFYKEFLNFNEHRSRQQDADKLAK